MKKKSFHPPKKNMENNAAESNILEYSAKKNNAKIMDENSILYPATSSPSASGKSNGVRFVSANREIKKQKALTGNIKINQIFVCKLTISIKFKVSLINNKGKIDINIVIS